MTIQETYRMPTIEVENKDDLIRILASNPPGCIFEHLEEVLNPVGLQWNYILTVKVLSDDFGAAIVRYKESFYEKPPEGIIAVWLRDEIPSINCWHKGILKP